MFVQTDRANLVEGNEHNDPSGSDSDIPDAAAVDMQDEVSSESDGMSCIMLLVPLLP
jgi:hypothetical protein